MAAQERRARESRVWAVIGLGQIGTSIGLALRRQRPGSTPFGGRLVGYDPDDRAAAASRASGAVEVLAASPEAATAGAELVILAAPAGDIPGLVESLAPHIASGCVLTDVASAKTAVVQAMDRHLGTHGNYVGGHPMAGREQPGPTGACADLFIGRTWAVCPGARTSRTALAKAFELGRAVGAVPVEMAASDHDRQVAWTSHLPYITAVALARTVDKRLRRRPPARLLAAGGLLDGTRVAASSPRMAGDYCRLNREFLLEALAELAAELELLQGALADTEHDETALVPLLAAAQAWRASLPERLAAAGAGSGGEQR